jgi:hypothetical protein
MSHKKILYIITSSLFTVCIGLLIGCNTHTESHVTHKIQVSFSASLSTEDIAKIQEISEWGTVDTISLLDQQKNLYSITFTPHPIKLDKNLFNATQQTSLSDACSKTLSKAVPTHTATITHITWNGSPSQQEIREAGFARKERVRQRRAERDKERRWR